MRILRQSLVVFFPLFLVMAGDSRAQQGPLQYVTIGGVPMHCVAGNGQLAALYIDPSVNQFIGIASNGGYPTIRLGPGFFNNVPPFVAQFWFLHECAHHSVGGSEAAADCFAIRNMRALGLVRHPGQVQQLMQQISGMAGTSRHLPGRQRAQLVYQCLNS